MQEIRNWHATVHRLPIFQYYLVGNSFILAMFRCICIRAPIRLLLTHWTRLWTVRKHINGTHGIICSGTFPIISHMKRIYAIRIWQNSRVIFLSPIKKSRFPTCQLHRATVFLNSIGKLHRTLSFYSSMLHFHYWLLPKKYFSKLVKSSKIFGILQMSDYGTVDTILEIFPLHVRFMLSMQSNGSLRNWKWTKIIIYHKFCT